MNKLNHIAFIMDGNGRWGKNKKKGRNFGHLKGVDKVGNLLKIPKFKNKALRSIQVLGKGGIAEQVDFSPYEKRIFLRFLTLLSNLQKSDSKNSIDFILQRPAGSSNSKWNLPESSRRHATILNPCNWR